MIISELDRRIIKTNVAASDKIDKFLSKKCPIAYYSPFKIYKGINIVNVPFFLSDSTKVQRVSQNTTNFYTILIDNVLPEWKNFPKRSKSFICTTDSNNAIDYGSVYRLYPIGDPYIGICSSDDLWNSFKNYDMGGFSYLFRIIDRELNISIFDNLTSMTKGLKEVNKKWLIRKKDETVKSFVEELSIELGIGYNRLMKFDTFTDVLRYFMEPVRNKFELVRLSSIKKPYKNREFWFSGKAYCKAVDQSFEIE